MWAPEFLCHALPQQSGENSDFSKKKGKRSSPECLACPLPLGCWEVLSKGYCTLKPSVSLWTWLMSFQRVVRSWKCGQGCLPPSWAARKLMSVSFQVLPWKHMVALVFSFLPELSFAQITTIQLFLLIACPRFSVRKELTCQEPRTQCQEIHQPRNSTWGKMEPLHLMGQETRGASPGGRCDWTAPGCAPEVLSDL